MRVMFVFVALEGEACLLFTYMPMVVEMTPNHALRSMILEYIEKYLSSRSASPAEDGSSNGGEEGSANYLSMRPFEVEATAADDQATFEIERPTAQIPPHHTRRDGGDGGRAVSLLERGGGDTSQQPPAPPPPQTPTPVIQPYTLREFVRSNEATPDNPPYSTEELQAVSQLLDQFNRLEWDVARGGARPFHVILSQ